MKRVLASMRTRQSLVDLIERRLSSADRQAELVKLATRLIVEEALESEGREALARAYYEHGAEPGQEYRNGSRIGRLKTSEGFIQYSAPQVSGREEPFRSPSGCGPGNAASSCWRPGAIRPPGPRMCCT